MYEEHSVKARLGEGLNDNGFLSKDSVRRTIESLKFFREILNIQSIKHILPIATSAVRDARNKEAFLMEVYKETGFRFKVLSAEEEALYSYLGALKATCISDALFFDLGGGSLELVYAKDYNVKSILSLPLGALRLSEKYSKIDGSFSKKNIMKMEREVLKGLPDAKFLNLDKDTKLVGVGGSMRAIARYDQKIRKYPLDKLHNYVIDYSSIESINNKLFKLNLTEISNIDAIGSNRALSIAAGCYVINLLMKKVRLTRLIVSTHGLREGFLSEYITKPTTVQLEKLDKKRIRSAVKGACGTEILPKYTNSFMKNLIFLELIKRQEYQIFVSAKRKLSEKLYDLTESESIFHTIMNDIFPHLGHKDQLVLALSIIFKKKAKDAGRLLKKYGSLLESEDKKSVERVAVSINLTEIFERYRVGVEVKRVKRNADEAIIMNMKPERNSFPEILLRNNLKIFESAFDVHVDYGISAHEKQIKKIPSKLSYNYLS